MITLVQAILLGLCCGYWKSCMFYTIGGFNINTVVFNAVFVGLIMGDMASAMIVGAAIQLIYLGVVAAGGNQPSDPCLASYVAIPIALASGLNTSAAVALAVPVGLLGSQVTNLVYLINGFFLNKADDEAKKGNAKGVSVWGLYVPFVCRVALVAIPVAIADYLGGHALSGVVDTIPLWLTNGLTAMGSCLPAVGFAIITNIISKPKYVAFFFAGFFMVQYSGIGTMPLLLLGAFITFLYVTFSMGTYKKNSKAINDDNDDDDDDDDDDEDEEVIERTLSKKDVLFAWLRWWTWSEVGHSFVRMMAPAFCHALIPAFNKFYPEKNNDPRYAEALQRQLTFFNTEAHFGGGPNLGLALAMEEAKSKDYDKVPGEAIMNIKTGLMGPLSGIGDTITWSTLMYLLIGLFLPLAQEGNVIGGIGPVLCLTIIMFTIGYVLTSKSYQLGYSFVEKMLKTGLINVVIMAACVLGLFMMGGLAATYVKVSTPIAWTISGQTSSLQDILDSILPGILPLITVVSVWQFLKKHRNYFMAAILVTVISLVLGSLGIII